MNIQEAKLILQAYRHNGQDDGDPLFAEALERARHDAELRKWFSEERAFDSHIQAKLKRAIAIPSDLKARLLAEWKAFSPGDCPRLTDGICVTPRRRNL